MTDPHDATYQFQLRSLLRMSADDLDRAADEWERTAGADNLHAPPAMREHAAVTARAHREAARLVRERLAELDAPPAEERPYTRSEIIFAITAGDADTFLEGKIGEDAAPTDALAAEYVQALRRTIDLDEGWGERLQTACEVAWEELVKQHPALEERDADDEVCTECGTTLSTDPEEPNGADYHDGRALCPLHHQLEHDRNAIKDGTGVAATAFSDDHRVEVTFDAGDWFAHASDDDIVDLADNSWGHAAIADDVAQHFEETTTKPLFDYLAVAPKLADGDPVGFECDVDEDQALAWIARFLFRTRPELKARLAGWYDAESSAGPGKETP